MCGINDSTEHKYSKPELRINSENIAFEQSNFKRQFELGSLRILQNQENYNLKYQPSLNLYGNAGLIAIEFKNIHQKFGFSMRLNLSIPIYDGKQATYE